jgi:hypothetical protein
MTRKSDNMFIIIVLILVLIFILLIAYYLNHKNNIRRNFVLGENKGDSGNHQCGKSCNSLDDLRNPAYNIRQIIKQTILLEEHIAIPSKRCHECRLKHLYHCQALAEEGLWLSTNHCKDYPLLVETVVFYNEITNLYIDNYDNEEVLQEILEKLRNHRKQLVEIYVINGKELEIDLAKAKIN